jgi:hypothetical protein
VTRGLIALLIVTCLQRGAVAEPQHGDTNDHDRNGAVTASDSSPWLDVAPAKVLSGSEREPAHDHRLAAGLTLGGLYAGFWGWAYIAWYRNHPEKDMHDIGRDGWFGVNTYAGGADKLGHAWATMTLARGGTALLDAGGWNHTHATLISAAMSELLFLGVEWKDYYYYEFSPGDFTFNTFGALTAVALELSPRLDELVDFRVEYWPSTQYRYNLTNSDSPCEKRIPGQPSCSRWNVAEDYSGETYLVALHLGGFHALRDTPHGWWSKLVDVAVGFETRNYKPPPTLLMEQEPEVTRRQSLFVGVTFNVQGLFDHLLPQDSTLRKVTHGVFEVITPPWTRVVPSKIETTRTTTHPGTGGA